MAQVAQYARARYIRGIKVPYLLSQMRRELSAKAAGGGPLEAEWDDDLSGEAQLEVDSGSEIKPFEALGLRQDIIRAVDDIGLVQPTEIQQLAIPKLLCRQDLVTASHTGSGKTFAYLLPLVQMMKEDEEAGISTKPKRPRAVVLLPTRELALQTLSVAKSLSYHVRFSSCCVSGSGNWKQEKEALGRPIDLVVATPGKLLKHMEEDNVYMGHVLYFVIDEADTLLDEGFGYEVKKILNIICRKEEKGARVQKVLVSATVGRKVDKLIKEEMPQMHKAATDTLHRAPKGVRYRWINVAADEDKLHVLLSVFPR